MKFKAIILEGADCCGKTSFAKELYSREKNAILVHFPRLNALESVGSAIKNLTKTLYNSCFMEKFESLGKFDYGKIESTFDTMNNKILDAMSANINANAEDKNNFLNTIINIKRYYKKFIDSTDNKTKDENFQQCKSNLINFILSDKLVSSKIDNKELVASVESETHDDIEKRISKLIKSDESLVIIFDRFFMSGDVYNYSVPINIYKKYIVRIQKEFTDFALNYEKTMNDGYKHCTKEFIENINKEILENTEKYEKRIFQKLDILKKNEILFTSNIIKKCNYIFTNNIDENIFTFGDKLILNPKDITHLIFKTNSNLVTISKHDSKRKFDDYDQNTDIQTISRSCFDIYNRSMDEKTKKLILANGYEYITGEYFIRSIVVDSNEYLTIKSSSAKSIVQIGKDGSILVSNDNGNTWKFDNDAKLKVKVNKKSLNYVIQKINILSEDNASMIMNNIFEISHQKHSLLDKVSKVSRTSDIEIKSI